MTPGGAGNLAPGVRIKDNGPKAGLNGVDNGVHKLTLVLNYTSHCRSHTSLLAHLYRCLDVDVQGSVG